MTRWLLEVSPGVFVGHLSARVREQLWDLVSKDIGRGRALLIWSARSEQHYAVRSLGHEKVPTDIEGVTVMNTPYDRFGGSAVLPTTAPRNAKESWSVAARRRRYRNSITRSLR
nr:type I-E CRISPR-associated endoribonuclease Cas2e [Schaalia sp. ZJ1691]